MQKRAQIVVLWMLLCGSLTTSAQDGIASLGYLHHQFGVSVQPGVSYSGVQTAVQARWRFKSWETHAGVQYPMFAGPLPETQDLGLSVGLRRYVIESENGNWESWLGVSLQTNRFQEAACTTCTESDLSTTESFLHYGFSWSALQHWQVYTSIGAGLYAERFFDDIQQEQTTFVGTNATFQIGVSYFFLFK